MSHALPTSAPGIQDRRGAYRRAAESSLELKPIITPLAWLPGSAPAEPPPLTPIFPSIASGESPSRSASPRSGPPYSAKRSAAPQPPTAPTSGTRVGHLATPYRAPVPDASPYDVPSAYQGPARPGNAPARPYSGPPQSARPYTAPPQPGPYNNPAQPGAYSAAPAAGAYPTAPARPYPTASPVSPYVGGAPTSPYPAGAPTSPYVGGAPTSPYVGGAPTSPYAAGVTTGTAYAASAPTSPAYVEPHWVDDGFQSVRPVGAPGSPAPQGGTFTSAPHTNGFPPSRDIRPQGRAHQLFGATGRPNRWVAALAVVGALALFAVFGVGTWLMLRTGRSNTGTVRNPDAASAPVERDISSRDVDPNPLTEAEVYPTDQIAPVANEKAYTVLKKQSSDDCRTAAADDLGTLLANSGCTQVVRATLKHPTGQYLITAGLFNLADQSSADAAHNGIKPTVDAQKGRFTGLAAGAGTDAIVRAPTQLGWNVRGHFLAYCVIARADGQPFAANDQFPKQIIFDLIETYLGDKVIGARAAVSAGTQGAIPDPAQSP